MRDTCLTLFIYGRMWGFPVFRASKLERVEGTNERKSSAVKVRNTNA